MGTSHPSPGVQIQKNTTTSQGHKSTGVGVVKLLPVVLRTPCDNITITVMVCNNNIMHKYNYQDICDIPLLLIEGLMKG